MNSPEDYRHRRKTAFVLPLNHPDYALAKAQLEGLRPFMKKDWGTILDFGAGNAPYRPLFRCKRYVMADVSQNADGTIDLLLDPESGHIPLETGSCDLVLCLDVLEHVPKELRTLRECLRVLKSGGIFLAGIPFLYREHETPADFRRYTADGIAQIMSRAGFAGVEIVKVGNRWVTLFNILYESAIGRGEKVSSGWLRTWFFRGFNKTVLPVLNRTVFRRPPGIGASTYARLLLSAVKPEMGNLTGEKREIQ